MIMNSRGLVEPTALKMLVMVILGSLVLCFIAISIHKYSKAEDKREFRNRVKNLTDRIDYLKTESPGIQLSYRIEIPAGFSVSFENKKVIMIGDNVESYRAGIKLDGNRIKSGIHDLVLKRTKIGVKILEENQL